MKQINIKNNLKNFTFLLAHIIYTIVTDPIAAHPSSLVSPLLRSLLLCSFFFFFFFFSLFFFPLFSCFGWSFFLGSRCGLLTTVDCCIEKIPLPTQMLKIFAKTWFFFMWLLLLEFWFCGWMGRRGEICCTCN